MINLLAKRTSTAYVTYRNAQEMAAVINCRLFKVDSKLISDPLLVDVKVIYDFSIVSKYVYVEKIINSKSTVVYSQRRPQIGVIRGVLNSHDRAY